MEKLILASKSPRRRELMGKITEIFSCVDSNADESIVRESDPELLCVALARLKCSAAAKEHADSVVIGCDTIVYSDGLILGKPKDREEAFSMLRRLSGATHSVYTGVWVIGKGINEGFFEKTDVTFCKMSESEIEGYVATGDPFDKAGGYGIQNKAACFVRSINGDYFNVMGLPVSPLYAFLKKHGVI